MIRGDFGRILLAAAIGLCAHTAHAAGPDIAAGRAMADDKCARCHAVGATGKSPFPTAPAFRAFSSLWPLESIEEALAEGMMVGHPEMPDFAPLSTRQIENFIGYLRTIQRR